MANKPLNKIKVDKEIFMNALRDHDTSIRKLGRISEIGYTEKSIRRGLTDSGMTERLFWRIAGYLKISATDLGAIGHYSNDSHRFNNWWSRDD